MGKLGMIKNKEGPAVRASCGATRRRNERQLCECLQWVSSHPTPARGAIMPSTKASALAAMTLSPVMALLTMLWGLGSV